MITVRGRDIETLFSQEAIAAEIERLAGEIARGAPEVAALSRPSNPSWSPAPTIPAARQADKPVQILYGTPAVAPTRLAFSGDTHPAPLPGTLGGVYPVAAGPHPAGVARLGSVQNVRDLRNAARRTPAE